MVVRLYKKNEDTPYLTFNDVIDIDVQLIGKIDHVLRAYVTEKNGDVSKPVGAQRITVGVPVHG